MTDENDQLKVGSLEIELLELLARQAKRVPLPVFFIAAVIAGLSSQFVPAMAWAPWLAAVATLLVVRRLVLVKLPTLKEYSIKSRLNIAIVLSATNGILHGLSLFAFPFLSDFERAFQTMLLTGLCTGAVVTTAGFRPIFLAYLLPIFVPLFFLWSFNINDAGTIWVNASIAVLVILFGAILIAMASDSYRLFSESFEIRHQQAALNKQLREALNEADIANKAKMRFLASASHDLRQPLHTLSLYGAALTHRPLDGRSREIAENMQLALHSLGSQLDALLDISRLDAGVVKIRSVATDLTALLERIRSEFSPAAQEKRLELKLQCLDDVIVLTDETLFERILVNLLSNAIKYTDNGHIDITLEVEAGMVEVTIADTGQGIPDEEQKKVFEEFYQLSNPHRDRADGFGLGLSIVKRLAELLDINISMQSKVGNGTQFKLRLPRATNYQAPAQQAVELDPDLTGLRILTVDDEAGVRESMKSLLESLGCRVELADSTEAAVRAVRKSRPDIMLVDFRLRDNDNGLDTVSAARDLHPGLPVVMISGDTAPDRLREANEAGIKLLHKPVAEADLKKALAAACATETRSRNGDGEMI